MITTERLILRDWRDSDRAPFAAMGQDTEVMRYLGPLRSRAESDAGIDRMIADEQAHGFAFWALERRKDGSFLGLCGLDYVDFADTPITGEVEIGWRLRRDAHGQGYAFEAASATLSWAFAAGLARIVAMTTRANMRSWGLMARLGMRRRADLDFDHPAFANDDPLRPHIVYAIDRPT